MAIKRKISKLEDVPEILRGDYEPLPNGEGFRLKDPEFDELSGKLEEFRTNNRTMFNELKELKGKLPSDFNPEAYKRGMEALQKIEQGEIEGLLKAGKIDDYLEKKTHTMRKTYEEQIAQLSAGQKKLEEERNKFRSLLEVEVIDKRILEAIEGGGPANRSGVGKIRPGAREDVLHRGRTLFGLDPNDPSQIVLKQDQFDDTGKKLSLDSWAAQLAKNAVHLLEPSKGGGAGGGSGGPAVRDGKTVLRNPSPTEFARHAAKIASGEIIVERT